MKDSELAQATGMATVRDTRETRAAAILRMGVVDQAEVREEIRPSPAVKWNNERDSC